MIFLLDTNENMVGVLDNRAPFSCPFWNDRHTEALKDGVLTYYFECPAEHSTAEKIDAQGFVIVPNLDGDLELFRIVEVIEVNQGGQYIKQVTCENAAVADLRGQIIRPTTLTGYAADNALAYVLQNTGWQAGVVEWAGVDTYEFKNYETALAAVLLIAQKSELELRWRVEFSGNTIKGRYVDLLERRGRDTKKRFEYGQDIEGVKRHVDSTDLCTALIGLGKADEKGNRLTFTNIAYGDKPVGQDYLEDVLAMSRWSKNGKHIFGVYEDNEAENATVLAARTQKELDRRKNPIITYEVSVTLLEKAAGMEAHAVRLGDTVLVIDTTFNPELYLEARIIQLERSYTDPTKDKATLGEYRPLFVSKPAVIEDLERQLATKAPVWDAKESVVKSATAPSNPTQDMLWLDTSTTPNVLKRWSGSQWVKATPTVAAEVGAETPTGAQQKADAAKTDAINTAAQDATTKANTAETNAKNYAAPAIDTLNDPAFENGKSFYSALYVGKAVSATTDPNVTVVAGAGTTGGNVLQATGEKWLYYKNAIPVDTSRTYRMTFRVRQTVDPSSGGAKVYAGVATLDSNYQNITGGAGTHRYCAANAVTITASQGWQTFTGVISGVGDTHSQFRPGTAYVRPMFIVNYQGGNGVVQIDLVEFTDITQETTAKTDLAKSIGTHLILKTASPDATTSFHTASSYGIYITTTGPVNLGRVRLDAGTGGATGTIILRNQSTLEELQRLDVTLQAGTNYITLDFYIPGAGTYFLGTASGWTGGGVRRTDSASVIYPYNNGSLTITGGGHMDSGNANYNDGRYYYFYELQAQGSGITGTIPSTLTVPASNLSGSATKITVVGSDGTTVVDADGNDLGAKVLTAGVIISPSVVNTNYDTFTYYVNTSTGDDENDGSSGSPFKTVQAALNRLPKHNEGAITIDVTGNTTEDILVDSFQGKGTLDIKFNNYTVTGVLSVNSSSMRVNIYNGIFVCPDGETKSVIRVYKSMYAFFQGCKIYGRNQAQYVVEINDNSFGYLNQCEIYNADTTQAFNACVRAAYTGRAVVNDCVGSGAKYGVFASYGGVGTVVTRGPVGTSGGAVGETATGGTVNGATTTNGGTPASQPAPPKVATFSSIEGDSYRYSVYPGWRNDGKVRQGQYGGNGMHRGFWFFGSSVATTVQGKTISKIQLECTRLAEGGTSSAVTAYFYPHNYATQPGGSADMVAGAPSYAASFKWGEKKTITLPSSFHSYFQNGTAQGIGIKTSSTSNSAYMIFDDTAKLIITYS